MKEINLKQFNYFIGKMMMRFYIEGCRNKPSIIFNIIISYLSVLSISMILLDIVRLINFINDRYFFQIFKYY